GERGGGCPPPQQCRDQRIVAALGRRNVGRPFECLTFDDSGRGRRQLGSGGVDALISGGDGFGQGGREPEPVADQRGLDSGDVNPVWYGSDFGVHVRMTPLFFPTPAASPERVA